MDSVATQKLHEVYGYFTNSPDGMDGVHFARLCRDLNLELVAHNNIPGIPATTFDLIFARAKSRSRRRLDFNEFLIALDLIGQRTGLSIDEIIRAVCTLNIEDQFMCRGTPSHEKRGPEKFFYDQTTYTGTHRFRQSADPKEDGSVSGRAVELKEVVNRDAGDQWMGPRTPVNPTSRRRPQTAPLVGSGDVTPMRGPQRFFYDRSTYTGVHKHTTPVRKSLNSAEMEKENTPVRVRKSLNPSSEIKSRTKQTSLPETAAGSAIPTPLMSSSVPALMTLDEFLAAQLMIMPSDDYFSSFLRRPNGTAS